MNPITWITSSIAGPVCLALAILFGGTAAVQTVRINGVSVFGWYAIDGYKPELAAAQKANATYAANEPLLKKGIDDCNASIANAHAAGIVLGRNAQAAADAAGARVRKTQQDNQAILAIKPGANTLVTALKVAQGRQVK